MNPIDISSAGLLTYVQVRCWSARKLDRKQTLKTVTDASATADAARVNKHLLAGADDALRAVNRKGNEIREYIDSVTLPWDNAGYRLLDNARALEVVATVRGKVAEFYDLVDQFVDQYPVLRAQALANLGDMAAHDDYPQPDVVRQKFHAEVTFSPIPTGYSTNRYGMAEAITAVWNSNFSQQMKLMESRVIRSALERLSENLQRYSDRLTVGADGKRGRFTETMVTQLNDTIALIEGLGLHTDPDTASLLQQVKEDVAAFSADELRSSEVAADQAKDTADDVLRRMRAFL